MEDNHAPCGRRFVLKAVPFSKNITFGVAGNSFVFYESLCIYAVALCLHVIGIVDSLRKSFEGAEDSHVFASVQLVVWKAGLTMKREVFSNSIR